MAVIIESLGVSVTGQLTRRYDSGSGRTVLSLDQAQAQELFNALGPVLQFFESQSA